MEKESVETSPLDYEGVHENHCGEAVVQSFVEKELEESQNKTSHPSPSRPTEHQINLLNRNGIDQSFETIDKTFESAETQNNSKSSEVIHPPVQSDNLNLSSDCTNSKLFDSEPTVSDKEANKTVMAERESCLNLHSSSVSDSAEDVGNESKGTNEEEIVTQLQTDYKNQLNLKQEASKFKLDEGFEEKILGLTPEQDQVIAVSEEQKKGDLSLKDSDIGSAVSDKVEPSVLVLGKEEDNPCPKEELLQSPKKYDLMNFLIEKEEKTDVTVANDNKIINPNSDPKIDIDIEEESFKIENEEGNNPDPITEKKIDGYDSEECHLHLQSELHSETKRTLESTNNNLEMKDSDNINTPNENEVVEATSDSASKTIFGPVENNDTQETLSQGAPKTSDPNTEPDRENICRNENDVAEVVDTEMVDCNEIEMIDLSENEFQKDKDIDRIAIDSNDTNLKAEAVSDVLESSSGEKDLEPSIDSKNQSNVSSTEKIHTPGYSEEETITGDTGKNMERDKDDCIIPDDTTPKLNVNSIKKYSPGSFRSDSISLDKSDIKLMNYASNSELEESKTKDDTKNQNSDISLSRPLRNAAKLAGNKIRSLVLNEHASDMASLSTNMKEDGNVYINKEGSQRMCVQCKEVKLWKFLMVYGNINQYLCSEQCSEAFAKICQNEIDSSGADTPLGELIRKCAECQMKVTLDEKCLHWETMDFCNENCLGKYQTTLGSNCANCKGDVFSTSMGKYCVRFGCDVKQFCSGTCLEEYKKGLKVCSYCQKDISTGTEAFLAPVGDKGQFKDFCSPSCMEKYEQMSGNTPVPNVNEECAVCSNYKPVRLEVELDDKTHKLCSEPCFAAFKFVNNITEGQCDMCRKYFDRTKIRNLSIFFDEAVRLFCCKTCLNVYILAHRKIIPCNWCKVKKYNFDMIRKGASSGQVVMMCSLNCLTLYELSINTVNARQVKCDFCMILAPSQYHLTMSDATTRNFCNYNCVISFQNQYSKQGGGLVPGSEEQTTPIPTGLPRKVISRRSQDSCVPVISSVQSLATSSGDSSSPAQFPISRTDIVTQKGSLSQSLPLPASTVPVPAPPPQIYQQIITRPPLPKKMKNKSILCKPYSHTKGVSCRPHPCVKETQTDQSLSRKFLIPIPVPIYVPCPMHMFATPFPVPVPFPLPVPVPIFIPTTRNSAKGIMKEIKKIQEKIPTDPFEAELLMMAEIVAGEKKPDPTDSESEEGNDGDDGTFSPDNVDTNNTFGDDMLQMALKMATELEEPAVDMESVLTSNTITTQTQPPVDPSKALYSQVTTMPINRGRKRSVRGGRNSTSGTPSKRGRRTSGSVDVPLLPPPEPVPPPRIEVEKPDADMCLKYTFGVNAWRHWVMQKNAELEKAAMTNRKIKLFKPELLQLTADELNFSLCLFVKEVRKPNGMEYAPDTIYYLCLGIQQYLFENGRIDNIFTDSYYEKFTDCLDEVAKKFAALYNDSQYIVTRVEEEHLWESKQLGAHSPHVLLSTLMFFNTKHFNLVTVEEHMQLSFSHIMKHWKRNPNAPGAAKVPGSRNVLLRFYPPQSALEANSRKKKVYEQQENEENPLRCPVKLYEFYLSKCPESVKTRNDVFYLLPERSCVPDSPVWYSTMALGKEPLMKMLHRVKMVKEINIALLSC